MHVEIAEFIVAKVVNVVFVVVVAAVAVSAVVVHRFLHTLDTTFSLYWGENRKILSMLRFEQEASKYLVSKFVLKYNIKPWEYFHPVCCWRMLRWIASS